MYPKRRVKYNQLEDCYGDEHSFTEIEEHHGLKFMLYDLSLLKLVQKNKNEILVAEKRNLMKNLRIL